MEHPIPSGRMEDSAQQRPSPATNVPVERHAAALCQSKLLYLNSSNPSDLERSYVACPLQRKLGGVASSAGALEIPPNFNAHPDSRDICKSLSGEPVR